MYDQRVTVEEQIARAVDGANGHIDYWDLLDAVDAPQPATASALNRLANAGAVVIHGGPDCYVARPASGVASRYGAPRRTTPESPGDADVDGSLYG